MRKSIVIVGTAVLAATSAHAQTQGFVSGQMSMSSTSSPDDDAKTASGIFGPVVGYNFNEKIVVGLGLNYTGNTVSDKEDFNGQLFELDNKTNLLTIAPFMRYMKKVDEDFSLYGQLTLGVGFGKNTDENIVAVNNLAAVVETESDVDVFSTSIGPGVVYSFAPRWAVNADWGALRYESRSVKADVQGAEKYTTNTFGLALTPGAITFGLNWLF